MYNSKSYSIDGIIRYSPNTYFGRSLSYMVSKSENYHSSAENMPVEYSGQHKSPLVYSGNSYNSSKNKATGAYCFTPELLLKPFRRETPIINATEQIKELIEEAFALMLSKKLPQN